MATKRRYLVSRNPTGSTITPEAEKTATEPSARVAGHKAVRSLPSGHQVLQLTDEEANEVLQSNEELRFEEDQDLELLMPMPSIGFQIAKGVARPLDMQIVAEGSESPIEDVTVFVQGARATYKSRSGADGNVSVKVFETDLERVLISPRANFWSKVVTPPPFGERTVISLTPLEAKGPEAWHFELLGLKQGEMAASGAGVKIAIIDSGIAEHGDLKVTGGFNCLDGQDTSEFRGDEEGHGTHCAGIIAGRSAADGITGIAPDAEIYSLKVFPGGKLSDLICAIQWAIDNGMDVISLSLSIPQPSAALAEVITAALQRGIVCVAAAGNDGGPVRHPAAIGGVIAVSAIGNLTSFPPDSGHALRVSELANPESGLFYANFSNLGPEVAFCAPGAAVVSSVPQGHAAWDGTSIACSFITGLAALLLSAYPAVKTGDLRQVAAVSQMLQASSLDLDLPAELQGAGLPNATQLLAAAAVHKSAAARLSAMRDEHLKKLADTEIELAETRKQIEELLASMS